MSSETCSYHDHQLCSLVSLTNNEDPIGSASTLENCIVLEIPLPWANNVLESVYTPPGLGDLAERAYKAGVNFRFIGIAPDPLYSQDGLVRAFFIQKPSGPFAYYPRTEYQVPANELLPLLETLLFEPESIGCHTYEPQDTSQVRDLLVCTHGERDICCARFGEPAYQTLREAYASDSLRVWRCSHIGGHKFAPTLIDLPEGRYWGHLSPEALPALVLRNTPFQELKRYYRGSSALGKFEQIVEREALAQEGWAWTRYLVQGKVLHKDTSGEQTRVKLSFVRPDGSSGAYEADVVVRGMVETLPSSGYGKRTAVPQYEVRNFHLVTDAPVKEPS